MRLFLRNEKFENSCFEKREIDFSRFHFAVENEKLFSRLGEKRDFSFFTGTSTVFVFHLSSSSVL